MTSIARHQQLRKMNRKCFCPSVVHLPEGMVGKQQWEKNTQNRCKIPYEKDCLLLSRALWSFAWALMKGHVTKRQLAAEWSSCSNRRRWGQKTRPPLKGQGPGNALQHLRGEPSQVRTRMEHMSIDPLLMRYPQPLSRFSVNPLVL